ncbi:MAG: hypothetical protein RL240_1593 [Planctomycetota bacterium]
MASKTVRKKSGSWDRERTSQQIGKAVKKERGSYKAEARKLVETPIKQRNQVESEIVTDSDAFEVQLLVRIAADFEVEGECGITDEEAIDLEYERLEEILSEDNGLDFEYFEIAGSDFEDRCEEQWSATGSGWTRLGLTLPFHIGDATTSHAIRSIFDMVEEQIGELECECKDAWLLENGKPTINLELLILQLDGVISRRTRISRQRRDTIAKDVASLLAIMFD